MVLDTLLGTFELGLCSSGLSGATVVGVDAGADVAGDAANRGAGAVVEEGDIEPAAVVTVAAGASNSRSGPPL